MSLAAVVLFLAVYIGISYALRGLDSSLSDDLRELREKREANAEWIRRHPPKK